MEALYQDGAAQEKRRAQLAEYYEDRNQTFSPAITAKASKAAKSNTQSAADRLYKTDFAGSVSHTEQAESMQWQQDQNTTFAPKLMAKQIKVRANSTPPPSRPPNPFRYISQALAIYIVTIVTFVPASGTGRRT